jgi:hypothetical protein
LFPGASIGTANRDTPLNRDIIASTFSVAKNLSATIPRKNGEMMAAIGQSENTRAIFKSIAWADM